MYSYTQKQSFGVDYIYEYNILDLEGNRICIVFDEEEAKLLLKHLNKGKEEKKC